MNSRLGLAQAKPSLEYASAHESVNATWQVHSCHGVQMMRTPLLVLDVVGEQKFTASRYQTW